MLPGELLLITRKYLTKECAPAGKRARAILRSVTENQFSSTPCPLLAATVSCDAFDWIHFHLAPLASFYNPREDSLCHE